MAPGVEIGPGLKSGDSLKHPQQSWPTLINIIFAPCTLDCLYRMSTFVHLQLNRGTGLVSGRRWLKNGHHFTPIFLIWKGDR